MELIEKVVCRGEAGALYRCCGRVLICTGCRTPTVLPGLWSVRMEKIEPTSNVAEINCWGYYEVMQSTDQVIIGLEA